MTGMTTVPDLEAIVDARYDRRTRRAMAESFAECDDLSGFSRLAVYERCLAEAIADQYVAAHGTGIADALSAYQAGLSYEEIAVKLNATRIDVVTSVSQGFRLKTIGRWQATDALRHGILEFARVRGKRAAVRSLTNVPLPGSLVGVDGDDEFLVRGTHPESIGGSGGA